MGHYKQTQRNIFLNPLLYPQIKSSTWQCVCVCHSRSYSAVMFAKYIYGEKLPGDDVIN